jgi:hypothetical protein
MVELLANSDLGVATMLPKVGSVVAQDRCDRRGSALDGSPRGYWPANKLVDAAQ